MAGICQDSGRDVDGFQSNFAQCANLVDPTDVFTWDKNEVLVADFVKHGWLQRGSINCIFSERLDSHVKAIDYLDFPVKRLMIMIFTMIVLPIVSIVIWISLIYILVLTL